MRCAWAIVRTGSNASWTHWVATPPTPPRLQIFAKQIARVPIARSGTRAAAQGVYPSHWEPGMGYQESIPKARQVADFHKQSGRIEQGACRERSAAHRLLGL